MIRRSDRFRTELDFVEWLQRRERRRSGGLIAGIGDDAAVLRLARGRRLLLTTDLSIEGVHFAPKIHPPRVVGHRALARSLSDVAAMGGVPRFALISLAINRRVRRAWVESFYEGFGRLARRFGVTLVGGDTALTSGPTTADTIVLGIASEGVLLRSGAKPGDSIFVTGRLGVSAVGLAILKNGATVLRESSKTSSQSKARSSLLRKLAREAVETHSFPEPRVPVGRWLAEKRLATSCIDLSDGLSLDLLRMCRASHAGATIWADRLPLPTLAGLPTDESSRRMSFALDGGEDYELLFTVPKGKIKKIPARIGGVPISRIGEMTSSKAISLITESGESMPLHPRGFDHFARSGTSKRAVRPASQSDSKILAALP